MSTMSPRALCFAVSVLVGFGFPCGSLEAAPGKSKPSKKPALAEKLDELIQHPGDYSQNCDFMDAPFPAALPAFRSIMHGEAGFSKANVEFMKKNREGIIAALSVKMKSLDFLRKPRPLPAHPDAEARELDPVGADPGVFSPLLLTIIEELQAVEVLPQILLLEEKYYLLMLAFEKNPAAPAPLVDGTDGIGVIVGDVDKWEEMSKEELARQRSLFRVQAIHRDMLAVMVRLIREKSFPPLLASSLEKRYGELLKEEIAKYQELASYKTPEDIPKEHRHAIQFDPVHHVPFRADHGYFGGALPIPYTPELRKEILDLAKAFIASQAKK